MVSYLKCGSVEKFHSSLSAINCFERESGGGRLRDTVDRVLELEKEMGKGIGVKVM